MLLPFAEKAYIDTKKLVDYCLSETHVTGRHKARVFKATLNLTASDFLYLKEQIATAVLLMEAISAGSTQQGDLYTVDFKLTHNDRSAPVRTAWIVLHGEFFPRLVSCYVNK